MVLCLLPVDVDDGGALNAHVPCLLPVDPGDGGDGVRVACLPNSRSDGGMPVQCGTLGLGGLVLLLIDAGLALLPGLCRAALGLACSSLHILLLFPGLL